MNNFKRVWTSGIKLGVLVCAALIAFAMIACDTTTNGGGGGTVTTGNVTSVEVTPTSASIALDGARTRQFTATVSGTGVYATTVTWKVEGGKTGTSISSSGLLTLASDEATGSNITVRATSTADTTKSGTAAVTVYAKSTDIPKPTGVAINPTSASVAKGGSRQFSATVQGPTGVAQDVTWSITTSGKHANTTITQTGNLSVAAAETLSTLTVKAEATGTAFSATATVTVTGGGSEPEPTAGKLTVSGLEAHNGKYVIFYGMTESSAMLCAAAAIAGANNITGVQVSGGKAVMDVYQANAEATAYTKYNGSDKNVTMMFLATTGSTFTSSQMYGPPTDTVTANFTNGAGTAIFSENSGSGEEPTGDWQAVTSINQVDGTWKGTFETHQDVGAEGAPPGTPSGALISDTLSTMIMIFNASEKTYKQGSTTKTVFSGSMVDTFWPMVKEQYSQDDGVPSFANITIDDDEHSITMSYYPDAQELTDAEISELLSTIKISPDGQKLLLLANPMDPDQSDMILTKQN